MILCFSNEYLATEAYI